MTEVYEPSDFPLSEEITRDYRIVRLLGKGGMGEVYLAEQLRVGSRLVALKVLNPECSQDPVTTKRFENEISAAGTIQHPNVVTIYESRVASNGQIYVAMEFIRGKSLRTLLREQGVLRLETVVELTKQICAGLGAAHKLGIVHRDIKPDNLMIAIDENGRQVVKVVDFGIARFNESGGPGITTRDGVIIGTPAYMSPEQAMGLTGDKIDARSDVYSVGMVVYEMLTGVVAFHGDSWMNVLMQHLHERPRPPREWRPELDIPLKVERAVLKALEKNRDSRQQTLAGFQSELEAAHAEYKANLLPTISPTPSQVTTIDVTPPGSEPVWRLLKQFVVTRKTLVLFSLLALLALATITTLSLKRRLPFATRENVIEYRISREQTSANDVRLNHTKVRSGEGIAFEFKSVGAGRLLVLHEDDYGFLLWLNPLENGDAQRVSSAQWSRVPLQNNRWILIDKKPRTEKFWLILVPDGLDWSITSAVAPERLSIRPEGAEVTSEAASRLMTQLKKEGIELAPANDATLSMEPLHSDENVKLAFCRIELQHEP